MQLPTEAGDTLVFHAGTKQENGQLLTNGGRVITGYRTAANYVRSSSSQPENSIPNSV